MGLLRLTLSRLGRGFRSLCWRLYPSVQLVTRNISRKYSTELIPLFLNPITKMYRHRPLLDSERYFRLFTIDKIWSYSGVGDRLTCQLDWYPVDTALPYHALSYEWGKESLVSVIVNGESLNVPKPLHTLLATLASRSTHDSSTRFFADAVCIHQGDNDEKKGQLRSMGNIFRNAACVHCWIGEVTKDDQDFLLWSCQTLRLDSLVYSREDGAVKYRNALREEVARANETSRPEFSAVRYTFIRHVFDLFRKSYWSRLWMVQEIVLAKELNFYCGSVNSFCIPRALLEHWLPRPGHRGSIDSSLDGFGLWVDEHKQSYDHNGILTVTYTESPWKTEYREILQGRATTLIHWRSSGSRPTMYQALMEYGYSACTDPLDPVYALRGIASDPFPKDLIDPQKSPITVFYETMMHCKSEINADNLFRFARKLYAMLDIGPSLVFEPWNKTIFHDRHLRFIPREAYSSIFSFPAELELEQLVSGPRHIRDIGNGRNLKSFEVRPRMDRGVSSSILDIMKITISYTTCVTLNHVASGCVLYRVRGTGCGVQYSKARGYSWGDCLGSYVVARSSSDTKSAEKFAAGDAATWYFKFPVPYPTRDRIAFQISDPIIKSRQTSKFPLLLADGMSISG